MPNKPIYFLGLDVSKADFHFRLEDALGRALESGICLNNPAAIRAFIARILERCGGTPASLHAAMEAGGRFGRALWAALCEAGVPTSVLNPAQVRFFARSLNRRGKTDPMDAATIARFVRVQTPYTSRPDSPHLAELRELVGEIDHLVDSSVRAKNRLKEVGPACAAVEASLRRQLEVVRAEIAALEEKIRDLCASHPELDRQVRLLCTIPGIASRTAWRVLAQIGSKAFASARQFSAYAGTCPAPHRSGSSVHRRTRMSKCGNARLRRALHLPALTLWRLCAQVAAWADPIAVRLASRKAALGAVMRKLVHIIHGVLTHGTPFDPSKVGAPVQRR
jgi:transposase